MTALNTEPNLPDADGFYERLIDAHRGLDGPASRRLNAKLILLLANHIGDNAVLEQAIRIACGTLAERDEGPLGAMKVAGTGAARPDRR